jgi:biotin carboxyl carrier protein
MHGKIEIDNQKFELEAHREDEMIAVALNGAKYSVNLEEREQGYLAKIGNYQLIIEITRDQKDQLRLMRTTDISINGQLFSIRLEPQRGSQQQAKLDTENGERNEGDIVALMPGTILRILVEEGQQINAGSVVAILEAMKMENEIKAPFSGTIVRIAVGVGQSVNKNELLLRLAQN